MCPDSVNRSACLVHAGLLTHHLPGPLTGKPNVTPLNLYSVNITLFS